MTMMLEVAGQQIPVKCEAVAEREWSRPSSMQASINNTPWGVAPQRPIMAWTLTFRLARPHELAMFLRLVYGEFGPGPFRLVDSTAAATNVLSASVSMLEPFFSIPGQTVSGPVELDDGTWAGRHLVSSGASMTPGWNFAAMSPGAGKPVTDSAFVQSPTPVRLRALWYTADPSAPVVVGNTVTVAAPGSGPLGRVHATFTVPPTITPTGSVAAAVSRVGFQVLDTARIAAPAISWTDSLTEWGMGGSPRHVVLDPPSASTIQAARSARGPRLLNLKMTAREVGAA